MNIEEIKKRTEEIKSYDYSFVERYINEKTRFDGTAINDHKKELVGSVEYLLSIIQQAEKSLKLAKEQIERDTFAIEWEWGKCRELAELIEQNEMPDAWKEVVTALKSIQGDE